MEVERMIKQNAPNHIIKYCYKDNTDDYYIYLHKNYETENSFVYKLRCTCGCNKFIVYQDQHPSIFAECINCNQMITIYDLDYYPSAIKLKKNFNLIKIDIEPVWVYVNYEYSDEYLYEEDVEFDADDITWGKVFIANKNELKKILDDETA